MANVDQWCFAWLIPDPHQDVGRTRAALLKDTMWRPGEIITVSFLDGDRAIQQKVKQAALAWVAPGMANLTLQFLHQKTKGDIRISFKYAGSWSVLGTSCRRMPNRRKPTMNFGWLDGNSSDDEIRRVVCHEFGHALGLVHEHQNPGGAIAWNREQVIKDLSGAPNFWPIDVIEHNMFEPYARSETNFTTLDPCSIMMYPIPAKWTYDGFSTDLNTNLSALDREFIRSQYP